MINLTKAEGGAGGAVCLLCTSQREDVWIIEFELERGGRLYVRLCTIHLNMLTEKLS